MCANSRLVVGVPDGNSQPAGPDGLADDDGDVLADGLMDALTDDDGDTLADSLELGLGLKLGDSDALGDCDAEGLIDADGLGDALSLAEGDNDADGLSDGEPIAATLISAHTLTSLVAPRVENVCTQNSYSPTPLAGHWNVASLFASGTSRSGDSVCTPPGSVT